MGFVIILLDTLMQCKWLIYLKQFYYATDILVNFSARTATEKQFYTDGIVWLSSLGFVWILALHLKMEKFKLNTDWIAV